VTLNRIAQGFAADRVPQILGAHGIDYALVDTGEFGALHGKLEGEPWHVGVQHSRVREAYVAQAGLNDHFLAIFTRLTAFLFRR